MKKRFAWLAAQIGICMATRRFIMSGWQENGGGFIEIHGVDNLLFWLNPLSYLGFYNAVANGAFTPSLQNPLAGAQAQRSAAFRATCFR
ncbi:hypothetical protein PQQ96_01675 [Paraburkholderia sediminicola]|uniref:hypothetical protein n=1 Tax=Paraburkholderia sediminicola TaxID=458836 RepID=UPI0038B6C390